MRSNRVVSLVILISIVAAGLAAPSFAQVKSHKDLKYGELHPFNVPRPERIVLDNGMVILLMEDHELPLVEITARVRGGARIEPKDKVGLAGIFAQVLRTGGTKSMTGDQIDEFLEARAALVETGMTDESATANLSCLTQDFPEVVKVFAEIMRNPVFSEDKLKISKNQVTAGISRRNDNPSGVMNREFEKLVYGNDSPYARVAEYETTGNVTREDLAAFHGKYFHPNRIVMGVVGDFQAKEMAGLLKGVFGDWKQVEQAADTEAAFQTVMKPGFYYVQKEDMTQSNIIMGHLGIRRDNPDYFAVEVLNEAFGGSFAARLFSNVRSKKGLAYSVRGRIDSSFDYPGTFNVFMTTKTGTTAAGIDALLTEVRDIVDNPPTEKELSLAKDAILNSFVFNFDSPGKVLRQQIAYEFFGYPPDFLARYRGEIEKVTPADVARVAKKYIHRDQMAILVVGPSKGTDRPLESFGDVAKLDITIPEAKGAAAPAASSDSLAKGKILFAKMIDALGGAAAVDAVKTVRTVSNSTVRSPQGELSIKVVSTLALPDRMRQELQTPMGQMVRVIAGAEGFMDTPMGAQPMPDSQRAEMGKGIRRQPVVLAQHRNDADLKMQYLGADDIGGVKVEVVLVTMAGDDTKLFIDPATGRVLREAYRGQSQAGPGDFVADYSDFREVSGMTFPFKTQVTMNGEQVQSSLSEEIALNPHVDGAMFAKPAAATATKDGK